MRRLVTITTLGLAISFSSLGSGVAIQRGGSRGTISFASDYMDLYTKQIAKGEVRNEIKGGGIEKDFMSFYGTPKSLNTVTSALTSDQKTDDGYISVFGVRVASESK